jgi:hypothetical protein
MARVILAILLTASGLLILVSVVLQMADAQSAAAQGALTYFELVRSGDFGAIATPIVGAVALVAGIGLWLRQVWGAWLAVLIGLAGVGTGLVLAYIALRDWSQPGSFAAIVLGEAVVAIAVGAAVAFAAWRTLRSLRTRASAWDN